MKHCSMCKEIKSFASFYKRAKSIDGLQSACKQCTNQASTKWLRNNSDRHKDKKLARARAARFQSDQYKTNHGCLRCGENDPAALDFHHVDPSTKEMTVSEALNISMERWQQEAAKCVILCANCHRKLHAGRFILEVG